MGSPRDAETTGSVAGRSRAVLGAEHDPDLWSAVQQALRDLGATERGKVWRVVGSQELQRLEVDVGNETVLIEGETYVGLSVTGPPGIVAEMATRLRC